MRGPRRNSRSASRSGQRYWVPKVRAVEEEPQDNHEEHPTSSDPRDPTQRQSTWHWADRRDPGTTQPTWADTQDPTQSTWADTPDPTQSTWADTPDSSQSTYTQDPTHSTWAGTNHSQPTWADPQDPTQSTWADTQNLSQSNWADAQDPTQSTFPSTQDSSQSTWVDPQRPTQSTWADAQDPSQSTWAASESSQYRSPPTDRSWQDQKNDQNDPIPQSGTGPEIDPPEWTGPGREPSKGNIEDVLQGCGPVKCPICGKYVRGGRWQLRSHQLTSSRCLAASGQAPQAREACELCGKQIAAGDAWAKTQHLRHCPGYRRRGRSSSRQHGADRYSDSASAASASDTHSLDARWRRRVRSQSSDRAVNRGRSASRRRDHPDWNNPATYFYRDPWEYESDDDPFNDWVRASCGDSRRADDLPTEQALRGPGPRAAEVTNDSSNAQDQDDDNNRRLWREWGWQDWSSSSQQDDSHTHNQHRYHDDNSSWREAQAPRYYGNWRDSEEVQPVRWRGELVTEWQEESRYHTGNWRESNDEWEENRYQENNTWRGNSEWEESQRQDRWRIDHWRESYASHRA